VVADGPPGASARVVLDLGLTPSAAAAAAAAAASGAAAATVGLTPRGRSPVWTPLARNCCCGTAAAAVAAAAAAVSRVAAAVCLCSSLSRSGRIGAATAAAAAAAAGLPALLAATAAFRPLPGVGGGGGGTRQAGGALAFSFTFTFAFVFATADSHRRYYLRGLSSAFPVPNVAVLREWRAGRAGGGDGRRRGQRRNALDRVAAAGTGGLEPPPDGVVADNDAVPSTLALVACPPAVRPKLKTCQTVGVGVEVAAGTSFGVAHFPLARNSVVAQADRAPRLVSTCLVDGAFSLEGRVDCFFIRAALAVRAVRAYPIGRRRLPYAVVPGAGAVKAFPALPATKRGSLRVTI